MIACPIIAALYVGLVCTTTVERVVDGDTFRGDFGRRGVSQPVRIVGVNTPEHYEAGYRAATQAVKRAYKGRTVTLIIGGAKGRRNGRCYGHAVKDRYGRVLARVKGWKRVIRRWDKGPWCR